MKDNKLAPWKCCDCDRNLPNKGFIWSHRKRDSYDYRMKHDNSGYRCDRCADSLEGGMDY